MQKQFNPVSAKEAVRIIKSGDRIFIHSVACAPKILINAMVERAPELKNIEIIHIHTEGDAPYTKAEYDGIFKLNSFFVGSNVRNATQDGRADYIPVFLSETPKLIRQNILPLDIALVQISPPDKHGYCSIGTSVDCTLAAIENAKIVIAQVNSKMPRAFGDAQIPIKNFDIFVEHDSPLYTSPCTEPSNTEIQIGKNVASLVEDGATLQLGIGAIPNAVLSQLGNHKKLGIHTEMFADGLIPLVEKGIVTCEEKKLNKGVIIASFLMGSQNLYNFIDDNPGVAMMDVAYTNDIAIIRQNPKVTAINSAIEIDITGQICSDSIGTKHYSGVGGQIDFNRGASFSEGGKPIIALSSVTKNGISKIVSTLKVGSGVVTTRPSAHYIITEYGIADLYGKSLQQRANALINISHPNHRENLFKEARERFGWNRIYSF
ncbi:MAG: acetyl-CoA hydrolase/transferase family protein [Bacteroidetes bacterium]|nr:acetyl-CoA hydrolase/transferase family protein [Bacteroidota bacterium]